MLRYLGYKKKDPTLVENYRPVSVLPCVFKVFKRLNQKQFYWWTAASIFHLLHLFEKRRKFLERFYWGSVNRLLKGFWTTNYWLLNYTPTGFLKLPWNWFSVICQTVRKEARLLNRLVLGLHYCNGYHRDLF